MSEWQFLLWFLANAEFTIVVPEEQPPRILFFLVCYVNVMGTDGINDLLIVNKRANILKFNFFF